MGLIWSGRATGTQSIALSAGGGASLPHSGVQHFQENKPRRAGVARPGGCLGSTLERAGPRRPHRSGPTMDTRFEGNPWGLSSIAHQRAPKVRRRPELRISHRGSITPLFRGTLGLGFWPCSLALPFSVPSGSATPQKAVGKHPVWGTVAQNGVGE